MSDIDYSGLADAIKSQTDKIVMQVKETEENFIFQTLKSYSENIVQREVSKKDLLRAIILSRAIINYFNPPQVISNSDIICPNCHTVARYKRSNIEGLKYIYCYKCGRRMKIR